MYDFKLSPYTFTDRARAEQITPAREIELLTAYRTKGDMKARDELLEGVRWVSAVQALALCKGYHTMEHFYDVFLEGQVATLKAMEVFDMERGTRFAAYAYSAVHHAQMTYMRESVLSIVPDPEKAADSDGKRRRTKLLKRTDVSLDAPLSDDENSDDGYARLADMRFNPEQLAEKRQIDARLKQAFTHLSLRERLVMHDCLLGDKMLDELRPALGNISRERVRQIGEAGIKKLRQALFEPDKVPCRKRAAADKTPVALPAKPVSAFTAVAAEPKPVDLGKMFELLAVAGGFSGLLSGILPPQAPAQRAPASTHS